MIRLFGVARLLQNDRRFEIRRFYRQDGARDLGQQSLGRIADDDTRYSRTGDGSHHEQLDLVRVDMVENRNIGWLLHNMNLCRTRQLDSRKLCRYLLFCVGSLFRGVLGRHTCRKHVVLFGVLEGV